MSVFRRFCCVAFVLILTHPAAAQRHTTPHSPLPVAVDTSLYNALEWREIGPFRGGRSANLASIYRDAGMAEVAVREAARAAAYDYANDAAHLFLSDSYNELRDPTRFNLRYETVWFNELLLANLFAPVGAGRLSQPVSAQEYSRLFQADGLHLANSTDVRSDGQLRQLASQSGAFGNSAWSLDVDYQRNHGVRVNHDLDRLDWYTSLKQQLTPQD